MNNQKQLSTALASRSRDLRLGPEPFYRALGALVRGTHEALAQSNMFSGTLVGGEYDSTGRLVGATYAALVQSEVFTPVTAERVYALIMHFRFNWDPPVIEPVPRLPIYLSCVVELAKLSDPEGVTRRYVSALKETYVGTDRDRFQSYGCTTPLCPWFINGWGCLVMDTRCQNPECARARFEISFENVHHRTWHDLMVWRYMFAHYGESIWCRTGKDCPYVRACTEDAKLAMAFRVCVLSAKTSRGSRIHVEASKEVAAFLINEQTCCRWPACQRYWEEVSGVSMYHAVRSNHAEYHLPHMCPDRTGNIIQMAMYPPRIADRLANVSWCICKWATDAAEKRHAEIHAAARKRRAAAVEEAPGSAFQDPDSFDEQTAVVCDGDDLDLAPEAKFVEDDPVPPTVDLKAPVAPVPKHDARVKRHYDPECHNRAVFLGYPCPCGVCPFRVTTTRSTPVPGDQTAPCHPRRSNGRLRPAQAQLEAAYASPSEGCDPDRPQLDYYVADPERVPSAAVVIGTQWFLDHEGEAGGGGGGGEDEPDENAEKDFDCIDERADGDDDDGDYGDMDFGARDAIYKAGFTETREICAQHRVNTVGFEGRLRDALCKYVREYRCCTPVSRIEDGDYLDDPDAPNTCTWTGSYANLLEHVAASHMGASASGKVAYEPVGSTDSVESKDIEERMSDIVKRVQRGVAETMRFFSDQIVAHSSHVFAAAPVVIKELIKSAKAKRDASYTDETGAGPSVYRHGLETGPLTNAVQEFWWEYALALVTRYYEPLEADRKASENRKKKAASKNASVSGILKEEGATGKAWAGFNQRSDRILAAQSGSLNVCKTLKRVGSHARSLSAILYVACCRIGNLPPVAMFLPYERLVINEVSVKSEITKRSAEARGLERRLKKLFEENVFSDGKERAAMIKTQLALDAVKEKQAKAIGTTAATKSEARVLEEKRKIEKIESRLEELQSEIYFLNCDLKSRQSEKEEDKLVDWEDSRGDVTERSLARESEHGLASRLFALRKEAAGLALDKIKGGQKKRQAEQKVFVASPATIFESFAGTDTRFATTTRVPLEGEEPRGISTVDAHYRFHTKETFEAWKRAYRAPQSRGVGLPLSVLSHAFSGSGMVDDQGRPARADTAVTSGVFGMVARYNPEYAAVTTAGDPIKRALAVVRNTLQRLHDYFQSCLFALRERKMTDGVSFRICKASCDFIFSRIGRVMEIAEEVVCNPGVAAVMKRVSTFSDPETNGLALLTAICDPCESIKDMGVWFPWNPSLYTEMAGRFSSVPGVRKRADEIALCVRAEAPTALSAWIRDAEPIPRFEPSSHAIESVAKLYQQRRDGEIAQHAVRMAQFSEVAAKAVATTAAAALPVPTPIVAPPPPAPPPPLPRPAPAFRRKTQWTVEDIQTTKAELVGLTKDRVKQAICDECAQLLCERSGYVRQFHLRIFKLATQLAYVEKTAGQKRPTPITAACTVLHNIRGQREQVMQHVSALVADRLKSDPEMSKVEAFDPEILELSRSVQKDSHAAAKHTNKLTKRKAEEALSLLLHTGSANASAARPVAVQSESDIENFMNSRLAKRPKCTTTAASAAE